MADQQPSTKLCRSCNSEKSASEFGRNRTRPDGMQTQCKACFAERKQAAQQGRHIPKRRVRPPCQPGTKWCCRCETVKAVTAFDPEPRHRDGLQSYCHTCRNEDSRQRRAVNPEKNRAYARQWAKDNPERVREKDRRRAVRRPGRTTAYARQWRHKNPEKANQWSAAWKALNPENRRIWDHNRRARMMLADGVLTKDNVLRIRRLQRDRCAACSIALRGGGERDHIVALTKGGSNKPSNIQLLCQPCNRRKHAKDPIDFMRELGRLL